MPQPPPPVDRRRLPRPALLLGAAGALPFLAGAALALAGPPEWAGRAAFALLAYGAAILSFLGGVHWGLAMAGAASTLPRLGASVLPALAGWVALLAGGRAGLALLAAGFAGLLAYDLRIVRAGGAPAWYPALRWPLTAVVLLCLGLAAAPAP